MKTIIFLILLLNLSCTSEKGDNSVFTIYLVRHAEKAISPENPRNPPLTSCGSNRAESLSKYFELIDLEAIHSSEYIRTESTARPTADMKDLEVQLYDPGNLHEMAEKLLDQKQSALVVGHSNTTPILAGLLSGKDLLALDESIYDRIYQVTISGKTKKLQVFQSAFECNK